MVCTLVICSLLPWLNMVVCMALAVGNLFFGAALHLACACTIPLYAGDSLLPSFEATVWTCAAVGWALLRHATSAAADAPSRSGNVSAKGDRPSGERKQNAKPRAQVSGTVMQGLD
jgi:hypothetical protein